MELDKTALAKRRLQAREFTRDDLKQKAAELRKALGIASNG